MPVEVPSGGGGRGRRIARAISGGAFRLFRSVIFYLGVFVLLFAGVNWWAYEQLEEHRPSLFDPLFSAVKWPTAGEGVDIAKRIFATDDADEATSRFYLSPGFGLHPILHYKVRSVDNRHYRIGIEGIRYDRGWTDEYVAKQLAENQHLVFLFGGSTVFGHGLSGNETLSYFMNQQFADRPERVLNLGAHAYDQHRELELLFYHLRSGARPKHVVFLDGINDIYLMARSNQRVQDKIVYHGYSVGRGEIALTPGLLQYNNNYLLFLQRALPIYRWLRDEPRSRHDMAAVPAVRDGFTERFDFQEAEQVFINWFEFAAANRELLRRQIITYYQHNIAVMKGLSRAFGFTLHVYYQPIGLFDPRNPFMTEAARTSEGYRYIEEMDAHIRSAIARGDIDMIDLGESLRDVAGDLYVDVVHYAPTANRHLAARMVTDLGLAEAR